MAKKVSKASKGAKKAPAKVPAKPKAAARAKPPAKAASAKGKKAVAKPAPAPESKIGKKDSPQVKHLAKAKAEKGPAKQVSQAVVKATAKDVKKLDKPLKLEEKTKKPSLKKEAPTKLKSLGDEPIDDLDDLGMAEDLEDIEGLEEVEGLELDAEEEKEDALEVEPDIAIAPVATKKEPKVKVEKEKKTRKKDTAVIDRDGDLKLQWQMLLDKSKGVPAPQYKMSDNFEARTPLQHKTLGWGFVISSVNSRLEVLFESGIKNLIANYKGS